MAAGKPSRLTAEQAAVVIMYVIDHYRREKQKEINRLRFSKATVRKLCIRKNLHESFTAEVISELAEWGWTMFPAEDDFGLIQTSTLGGWVRLGSRRIAAQRKRLQRSDSSAVQGIVDEMMQSIDIPNLDDDDDE